MKRTNNTLRRIDQILLAVSVDPEDQTEGVVAMPLPNRPEISVPLIAADAAREPFVREQAKIAAQIFKIPVKLIRLQQRVVVAAIGPDGEEVPLSS